MRLGNHRNSPGFSLIELLIALAIIGVLAALAISGYKEYILRSKQSAAKAVLLDIAQKQPQFLADRRSRYAQCLSAGYLTTGLVASDCATEHLSITPPADIAALYDFKITLTSPPPGYSAVAVPKAAEVGTTSLHIDQTGTRLKGTNGTIGTEKW